MRPFFNLFFVLFSLSLCNRLEAQTVLLENRLDKTLPYGNAGSFILMEDGSRAVYIEGEMKSKLFFFWIPEQQWRGKNIRVSIEAKGESLSRNFLFGIQNKDAATGKDRWDGSQTASGTFEWKKFILDLPMKNKPVKGALTIRIGMQQTTGKLFLRNFKAITLSEK